MLVLPIKKKWFDMIKAGEKLNLENAMLQAKRDSNKEQMPTVFHRKNNCKWLVTMELDDWIKIYDEYFSSMKLKESKQWVEG